LYPLGGYPGNEDKARELFQQLDAEKTREGFGSAPSTSDVPNIKAPLLIQYAETDERINAAWPAYEEALKAAKIQYQAFFYPGTQHGFNNDTTPRYNKEAAGLAWQRTIEFFNRQLRT
jgi:carboxymethylenebutenolidase